MAGRYRYCHQSEWKNRYAPWLGPYHGNQATMLVRVSWPWGQNAGRAAGRWSCGVSRWPLVAPLVGLGLEIGEIMERSQGPEVVADVVDGPFSTFPFSWGWATLQARGVI